MIDLKTKKLSSGLKFTTKNTKYTLLGDPTFMNSSRFMGGRIGDISKRNKTRDGITLTSQHDEREFYKPPLKMLVLFYFRIPIRVSSKRSHMLSGDPHVSAPDVINCAKYIEEVSKGILFQDNCFISTIEAHKLYDENPRADFYIMELK